MTLHMYTIYDHPRDAPPDYPFIVRKWLITPRGPAPLSAKAATTLTQARLTLPPGLHRTPRAESDDPTIVETWL